MAPASSNSSEGWAYAYGGDVSEADGWRIHIFKSDDNLVVSRAGAIDLLVVGGGGAGAGHQSYSNAGLPGGGAGGVVPIEGLEVDSHTFPVVVGDGGLADTSGDNDGADGQSSSLGDIIALGGGGGSYRNSGDDGGSGGGSRSSAPGQGLQPTSQTGGLGNAGSRDNGGGGGGAGSAADGQNGGEGYQSNISGEPRFYGGGGGGGAPRTGTPGAGGSGVGGNGGNQDLDAEPGAAHTGSGGGGGNDRDGSTGGDGGSGIVIVRYRVDKEPPTHNEVKYYQRDGLPYDSIPVDLSGVDAFTFVWDADYLGSTNGFGGITLEHTDNSNGGHGFFIAIGSEFSGSKGELAVYYGDRSIKEFDRPASPGVHRYVWIVEFNGTTEPQRLYIDGAQVPLSSTKYNGILDPAATVNDTLYIANRGGNGSLPFNGGVSIPTYYRRALTDQEIADQFAVPPPGTKSRDGKTVTTRSGEIVLSRGELIAEGIEAGATTFGPVTVRQNQTFAANGFETDTPTIGGTNLSQIHRAAPKGIATGAPTTPTKPKVKQKHKLTALGIAPTAPTAGTPDMRSDHHLSTGEIDAGSPTLGAVAIRQDHRLAPQGLLVEAPSTSVPDFSQDHKLSAVEITSSGPRIESDPIMNQNEALNASTVSIDAPSTGVSTISQAHRITSAGIAAGAPILVHPSVTQSQKLEAQGSSSQAPIIGAPVVAQNHKIRSDGFAMPPSLIGIPLFIGNANNDNRSRNSSMLRIGRLMNR